MMEALNRRNTVLPDCGYLKIHRGTHIIAYIQYI